jgi:hypothetical protein
MGDHLATMQAHQLACRFFQLVLPPPANIDRGAQFQERLGHFAAQTRAPAGHQNPLAGHQAIAEHEL